MTADERISLIRVKVERARKHIRDLELEIRAFLDSNPYVIETKPNHQRNALIYYLASVRDTPLTVAAITGDVLCNLRAALDHLAYHLVLVNGGTPIKQTYFPIFDDAAKYIDGKSRKVAGMRPEAIKAIDAIEPYKGGNNVLWQLHSLNNIDKHRILITVGSAVSGIKYHNENRRHLIKAIHANAGFTLTDAEADARNFFSRPEFRVCPLEASSVLLVDPFKREVNDKVQFAFEIAFNESKIAEGEPLLETLQQTAELVDNIVLAFKPLLA
ncbi:MAG: hypothetical protein ABR577_01085 [Pyrinomonadaceae bacterium]